MTARQTLGLSLALFAGLALLCGCDPDARGLLFSHHLHVKENSMACADCHGAPKEGSLAHPGHKTCMDCHSDWIDTKTVSEKTCGKCHQAGDAKALQAFAATAPTNPVHAVRGIFRHGAALSNRCAECHGAILDPKAKLAPVISRGDAVGIRNRAHAWGMDCQSCHADLNRDTPPPDHRQDWTRRHGAMAAQSDNACAVCHAEQTCRDCHQTTKPASHNNLWRLKTHGVQAAWDRSNCTVCHQQDACASCHAETQPPSHTAGWRQKHCQNCHTSSSAGTGCVVCHPGAGIGSAHPDPHSPGWRRSHCFSCHVGAPETQQCGVCHAGAGGSLPQIHDDFWPSVHNRFNGQNVDCYYCHEPASAAKTPRGRPRR